MQISVVLVAFLFAICVHATTWPTATGTVAVTATINVAAGATYDGALKRYYGSGALGTSDQSESQDPIFQLADGATIQNVIIGAPAADGVHCAGQCTIKNVWWEDVGEDAATFRGTSSSISSVVNGGGAKLADDKVFQHNGAGTVTIENFAVTNFGKLYRSCGNCATQYKRHVIIKNVVATYPGLDIAGINENYGDTATISAVTIVGDTSKKIRICEKFTGNNNGAEPVSLGSGADSTYCLYSTSSITYQ